MLSIGNGQGIEHLQAIQGVKAQDRKAWLDKADAIDDLYRDGLGARQLA